MRSLALENMKSGFLCLTQARAAYWFVVVAIAILGPLLKSPTSSAAPFSDLYVFGDSLSDVGNLSSATLGIQPGSDYFEGRFSNGPVYSEILATGLGFDPIRRSTAGGNNFAYGGGRTSGTSFFEFGFLIDDLDEQVDDFLANRSTDPDALHVVFAGSNDFILGDQTNPTIPVQRIEQQFTRLIDAGARHFLSINLPLLGLAPSYNNNANTSQQFNDLAISFNQQLEDVVDGLRAETPDVVIYEMDLQQLFSDVVSAPAEFGFTNVTSASISVGDPAGYLFWDDQHPTKEAHFLLGKEAMRTVLADRLPGDFDDNGMLEVADIDLLATNIASTQNTLMFDLTDDDAVNTDDLNDFLLLANSINGDSDLNGKVEFADFLSVAQNFGVTSESVTWSNGDFDANGEVQFPDFLILSRNFGRMGSSELISVPEPSGLLMILFATCCFLRQFNTVRE